jgi:dienelactone hydrolase
MRTKLLATLLLLSLALPAAAVERQDVTYDLPDGTTARGVLFLPDDIDIATPRPAVLVIPEWWGLTQYPQDRARQMAELGYIAFVADMYGERQTVDNPQAAQKLSSAAAQAGLAKLAEPALEVLREHELVDPDRIAAIGFCFGGSTVVAMATSDYGDRLAGVASFHGGLSGDNAAAGEYAGPPMLVLHGGADPMVPPAAIGAFTEKSLAAGVPLTMVNFPGALHAFSNPEADVKAEEFPQLAEAIAYDAQAEGLSMQILESFLSMTLADRG